ncbi:sperm-associated antigen 6-like [Amphibalanus amphitrite]|uniref:sperm-associated antigen 6-like n=1 Tax=Amphibalanus amphitrite TaxID=1232801 RepID=UPI001C9096B7|nr:sperm-associated antigen 6-like [Amphibalanus amphitrite]XP_043214241.1 sperm-associated antigen 6-like [Amphibalanus amphitrite]
MAARLIEQAFDQYNKSRLQFVQTVADLASRPQNMEHLHDNNVMSLLHPLLMDVVPAVQQTAALALGKLASFSQQLAQTLVTSNILPQLISQVPVQNRFYKKSACFVLRAVAKHSVELARTVIESGGLNALVVCLEEFDPNVKESAAWAIGYVARHSPELAQSVVDAGAVPLLVLCIKEPEIGVKRVAASALSDICKHSEELTHVVVENGAISNFAALISSPDTKLKRQILSALSNIAKHTLALAELVVEAEIFPDVFSGLQDADDLIRRNTAGLIKEIVKHTPELAQLIVNAGGMASIVDYLGRSEGHVALPGVMALGFTAAHSQQLAMSVIVSRGVVQLAICLNEEKDDHIRGAAVWALGQIGRHTPEHAKAIAMANLFPKLLECYTSADSSDDLQDKARRTLKSVLQMCVYMPALDPLLHEAPPNILKYVVGQYSKVLPHDPQARRQFVTSGCLRKVQEIQAEPGTELREYINTINNCFPEEIVRYYSPGYSEHLLERLETYEPDWTDGAREDWQQDAAAPSGITA